MVIVALALRLVVMSFLYPERTDPYRDHWRLGGEAGRIARSITQGEGFSNPLFGQDRAHGMAVAGVSLSAGGDFQDIWRL